jgi:hypothetical protein
MVSTVQTRPNFYEMLGLRPTATAAEISHAFAQKMSLANAMTAAAQICAAYETLRNPGKRLDYDRSIGLEPKAPPQPKMTQWTIGAAQWGAVPFVNSTRFQTIGERAAEIAVPPEAPAAQVSAPRPDPVPVRSSPPPPLLVEPDYLPEAEDAPRQFTWSKTAAIAGGLVVAVGLIGAWAGSIAGNDVEAVQSETLALPKAKPSAAAPAPAEAAPVAKPIEEPRAYVAPQRRAERNRRPALSDLKLEDLTKKSPQHSYYQTTAPDGTTEIAAAEAPPLTSSAEASAAAAGMPLSNATIARTLHKIGYRCGDVASTSAVDGSPGVFNVTCSSGQSYRASPVGGRYRFRKL